MKGWQGVCPNPPGAREGARRLPGLLSQSLSQPLAPLNSASSLSHLCPLVPGGSRYPEPAPRGRGWQDTLSSRGQAARCPRPGHLGVTSSRHSRAQPASLCTRECAHTHTPVLSLTQPHTGNIHKYTPVSVTYTHSLLLTATPRHSHITLTHRVRHTHTHNRDRKSVV